MSVWTATRRMRCAPRAACAPASPGPPGSRYLLLLATVLATLLAVDALADNPDNKITLTFAFDSTGSMSDELNQVKQAMQEIFDYMKKNRADEIANYALVEFNDPHARLMTITTNSDEYRKNLAAIKVDGGGDCPEMAMKGIKIALENSLPQSYIFVFTDASAKDHLQKTEVENIIQRKKSKVVFVLTGKCSTTSDPGYQAYNSVAQVSNGHVFNLHKNEVKKVLEYVKLDTGRKTVINSGEIPKGSSAILKTPVDETMKELTITVTGKRPDILLTDPTGKGTDGKTILELESVKSKQVQNPKPGNWSVEVRAHSPGRFVITTESSFNFQYGFSLTPTKDMAETAPRPLKGTENALLIKISNSTNSIQLQEVKIKDTKDTVLTKLQLHPVPGKNGIYTAGKFLPPNFVFLLEVLGKDSHNNLITRLSDSGISPQTPALPIISLEQQVTATLKSPFTLECHVESLVPFAGSWFKGNNNIFPETEFPQSSKIKYYIDNTTIFSGGIYTCNAKNIAGTASKNITLNVQVPPPSVKTPKSLDLISDQSGEIPCSIESELEYEITWEKETNAGIFLPVDEKNFIAKNGNLVIPSVKEADKGTYKCSAKSVFGRGESDVFLNVDNKAKVIVSEDKKFKANELVQLSCTASGSQPLSIIWKKNGINIPSSDKRLKATETNVLILELEKSTASDEGIYECEASNKVNSASATTKLQYLETPRVNIKKSSSLALAGSTYFLHCLASGSPKPIISWEKDEHTIKTGEFQEVVDNGTIIFTALVFNHSGNYQCIAENEVGRANGKVNVNVASLPQIENKYDNEQIATVGQMKELTCKVVKGTPAPLLTWYKDGEKLETKDLKLADGKIHTNGSFLFSYIKPDNEGTYECEAENVAGKDRKIQHLKVQEPPGFTDDQRVVIKVRPGNVVTLPCEVYGNPKPRTTWVKDNKPLPFSTNIAQSSEDDSILIMSTKLDSNGTYECIAINAAGRKTKFIDLFVQAPPRILPQMDHLYPQKGDEILLQCEVNAFPSAKIKWYKNGAIYNADSIRYLENNSSIRLMTDLSSSGEYTCVASNEAGEDKLTINVTVTVAPIFENEQEHIQVSRGENVTLSCHTDAVPPANYYWLKYPDTEPVQADSVITFENVDDDFAGLYRCEVENIAGYAQKIISVRVYTHPKITADLPENRLLRIGTKFSMPCFGIGDPLPSIKWLKNGKPLESYVEGLLIIDNVTKDDEGIYTCVAENYEGTDQKNMKIIVEAPPKMDEVYPPIIEVNETYTIIVACPAIRGIPAPTVRWLKDGEAIFPTRRISPKDKNRSLKIKRARKEDKGIYTCVATNSAGEAHANIPVEVFSPPFFRNGTTDIEVNQIKGTTVHLDCSSSGYTQPKVTWFKNNHPFVEALSPTVRATSNNQILNIFNARKSDQGIYKCVVENKAGRIERIFNVKLFVTALEEGYISDEETPGEWGPWSPWSECSSPCGHSEQVRTRACRSDIKACDGEFEEWRKCHVAGCKVDGDWTKWGNWSSCSTSCGSGKRFRERFCSNPTPQNGGNFCYGANRQHESCNTVPCPVDGSWSDWSKWESCTGSCTNSTMKRVRTCSHPSPAFGGKPCLGPKVQYKPCTKENCPVNGGWSEWSSWSPCSSSCGPSTSFRERFCNNPKPKFDGALCAGDSREIRKCDTQLCDNIPLFVSLKLTGTLNDFKISELESLVNITDLEESRLVEIVSKNPFKHSTFRGWYPYLPHVVAPVTWLTAFQKDKAVNGFTLTKGVFKMQTNIKFKSGENMIINHVGYGLGSDGILKINADIQGRTPLFPNSSPVKMEPYEESYIKTGPGELYVSSQNSLEGGGLSLLYSWTKITTFNAELGKLPYLVQKLDVQNLKTRRIKHKEEGTISVQQEFSCPLGFDVSKLGYCTDVDECSERRLHNCHYTQTCINIKGTYVCSCPPGLKASPKGGICKDIDECTLNPPICSHTCENLEGSFKCLCPPGLALLDSKTTCTSILPRERTRYGEINNWNLCLPTQKEVDGICKDEKPCEDNPHICQEGEICINRRGLYDCIPVPCPAKFRRIRNSTSCIKYCDVNECDTGALISETLTPIILTLQEPITPHKKLVLLTLHTESPEMLDLKKITFHIIQNEEGKPFRVKNVKGVGEIYSTQFLPTGQTYRILVLASMLDSKSSNVLLTNKYMVTIHTSEDTS